MLMKLTSEDDGSFLIDLVGNLLASYMSQLMHLIYPELCEVESMFIVVTNGNIHSKEDETPLDFLDILTNFFQQLGEFKSELRGRNIDSIVEKAKTILSLSDSIHAICTAFLDFVLKALIDIERRGVLDIIKYEALSVDLNEKLDKNKNRLFDEFLSLIKE